MITHHHRVVTELVVFLRWGFRTEALFSSCLGHSEVFVGSEMVDTAIICFVMWKSGASLPSPFM